MTRAGREPAEDVRRRLAAACEEIGLTVAHATMNLLPQAGARIVHVGASLPDWPYESTTLALMTTVPVSGQWPSHVDIRCCATTGDPARMDAPWMQGREHVPFAELIEQLRATLEEREQVIAAVKKGVAGPFKFDGTVWEEVDLLKGDS